MHKYCATVYIIMFNAFYAKFNCLPKHQIVCLCCYAFTETFNCRRVCAPFIFDTLFISLLVSVLFKLYSTLKAV